MTGFQSKRKAAKDKLGALVESPSRGVRDEIEIARLEKELSKPPRNSGLNNRNVL